MLHAAHAQPNVHGTRLTPKIDPGVRPAGAAIGRRRGPHRCAQHDPKAPLFGRGVAERDLTPRRDGMPRRSAVRMQEHYLRPTARPPDSAPLRLGGSRASCRSPPFPALGWCELSESGLLQGLGASEIVAAGWHSRTDAIEGAMGRQCVAVAVRRCCCVWRERAERRYREDAAAARLLECTPRSSG